MSGSKKGERAIKVMLVDEPAPCVGCLQWHRCRVEKLACYDFVDFARSVPQGKKSPKNRRAANELYYTWVFGGSN